METAPPVHTNKKAFQAMAKAPKKINLGVKPSGGKIF